MKRLTTPTQLLMLLSTLLALTMVGPAMGAITNMGDAINDAGRQRMLTQRMVKSYCMVGQNIDVAKSKKELSDAVNLFSSQLAALKQFRVNNDVTNGLNTVEQEWQKLKAMVNATPSKDQAPKVRDQAELVLKLSNDVVLMLQDASGSQAGHLVNVSGRQRMLSQRMASLYLLKAWGLGNARYTSDFRSAMSEFRGALSELVSAPENTSEITRGLKKVKTQYAMFEYSAKTDSSEFIPLTISNAAEKLLKLMNDITGMYANMQ